MQLQHKRILLVEDEKLNQLITQTLLNQWQAEVILAESGNVALDYLRKNSVDLILMDISMPGLDGYSTAKMIREELRIKTPIIAISADAGELVKQKVLEAGMNDFLSKPIEKEALLVKIAIAMEMRPPVNETLTTQDNKEAIAELKLCDIEKLRKVLGIDTVQLKLMIAKFLEITPNYYLDILHAFETNDMLLLSNTAHKLKASLELLSSMEMSLNIRLIKEYADNKEHHEKLPPLISYFRQAYPELCRQVQEELALLP